MFFISSCLREFWREYYNITDGNWKTIKTGIQDIVPKYINLQEDYVA